MRVHVRVAFGIAIAMLAVGCGSTVEYDPATSSDTTPPAVNLLVRRAGQPDLEVQGQTLPVQTRVAHIGALDSSRIYDFSVLATATDPESGIESMKLMLNRTVCYATSSGGVAQDYRPSETRRQVTYTDRANAPVQASLGETGIFNTFDDTSDEDFDLSERNLLAHTNANGVRVRGVGVSTTWYMEAENFNGTVARSNSIIVTGGDLSCIGG